MISVSYAAVPIGEHALTLDDLADTCLCLSGVSAFIETDPVAESVSAFYDTPQVPY